MLMNQEEVIHLLRCPKTGKKLIKAENDMVLQAIDPEKATFPKPTQYPINNGLPILIDFNNSVLDESMALVSTLSTPSYGALGGYLKRLSAHPDRVTRQNMIEFVQLLKNTSTKPKVLIIGGGTIGAGMECLYNDPDINLIAFDIYPSEVVQFLADAHNIPLPEGYFDGVIIQAVLEHVLEPHQVVAEIERVLGNNGIVYAETPFMQHVHGGAYDFTRFTESGHRYLFKNFDLIRSGALSGPGIHILWSIDFLFRSLFRSRNAGKIFKLLFFWMKYLDKFITEPYLIDTACGVFFMGKKSDTSITSNSIIRYYKGAQKLNSFE